ncbi:MAG: stage III sporulation protein AB [Clostridia bacterium]|nr:stage III sporulation protein AB [Clostridia bacterium]
MYLIKLFGVLLIVICCSLIGVFKSNSLRQKVRKLSMLIDGLNALYNYIDQGEFELNIAIKNAFCKCRFLNFSAVKILCDDADLKNEKPLIEEFFMRLGQSTKKIECDYINHFKTKMQACLNDARDDVVNKCKIYQILGVCSGLTLGILLV